MRLCVFYSPLAVHARGEASFRRHSSKAALPAGLAGSGQPLHHTYVAAYIRLAALPPVLYSRLISKRQDCYLREPAAAIFPMAPSPRRSAITVAVFLAACAAGGTLVQ